MSDIFISYASKERDLVVPLVEALSAQGWSIWWDRETIAGTAFDKVIEEQLDAASCVIVGWSHAALDSEWVRDEAEDARKRNILIPVLFEQVGVPLRFRRLHSIDLSGWQGIREPKAMQQPECEPNRNGQACRVA